MSGETGQTTSRLLNRMAYDIANKAADIGTATGSDKVLVADVSDDYEVKWADGANLLEMIGAISQGLTIGEDGTGYDVIFYSATAGKKWHWDESADTMIVAGTMDLDGIITNGEDGTGYDVTFFSATASAKMLWDESADSLYIHSPSADAFAVGLAGNTNPAFVVDSSTGSQAAGLKVTGATAAGNVAVAVISSGAAANLIINAKGTGTIGIGSVSTGAVTITPATTVTGAITPTGGIAAAGGFSASARCFHTGGVPATISTQGTDLTVAVDEMYLAEVFIPCNCTVTGASVFWGSATEGNAKIALFDSAGTRVAVSASTDVSGYTVDSYGSRIAFGTPYAAKGPASYWLGVICDNTANRVNTHVLGNFGQGKVGSLTYGTDSTFATLTVPTTFTTAEGPIATLYTA